jgi:hypothetical protein
MVGLKQDLEHINFEAGEILVQTESGVLADAIKAVSRRNDARVEEESILPSRARVVYLSEGSQAPSVTNSDPKITDVSPAQDLGSPTFSIRSLLRIVQHPRGRGCAASATESSADHRFLRSTCVRLSGILLRFTTSRTRFLKKPYRSSAIAFDWSLSTSATLTSSSSRATRPRSLSHSAVCSERRTRSTRQSSRHSS